MHATRPPARPPAASPARARRASAPPPAAALPDLLSLGRPTTIKAPGGLVLPRLGVGTWSWGNRFLYGYSPDRDVSLQDAFDEAVARKVMLMDDEEKWGNRGAGGGAAARAAFTPSAHPRPPSPSLQIALFDTGDSYGTGKYSGRAESLLGDFLAATPAAARGRVTLATKIAPYPWRLTAGAWVTALRVSLARMGVEQMALGQLHWSTADYAPWQERATWDGLIAAYDAGLIRAAGVSNYGPKQLAKVHKHLTRAGVPLATAQTQFSLLSTGAAPAAAVAAADDLGIVTLAYSPLALGMLSGAYGDGVLPSGPRARLFASVLPTAAPLLAELDAVAVAARLNRSQAALAWCAAKGTVPLVGCRTRAHTASAARAAAARLPPGAVTALDAAAARVTRPTLQNVFATR